MNYVRRDSSGSVTSAGIMHHQSKLDVFIIKAHRLLSNGAAINGEDVSIMNTASSSPRSGGSGQTPGQAGGPVGQVGSPQHDLTLFQRLSQLYNATISTSLLDDNSTSPKSAIELCQRFQQILKELELSYDVSPYGKYFRRLENGMWQIKDDAELVNDQLWQLVSVSISAVYDSKTGQMLTQTRRRVNSMATSSKNSPSEVVDNTLPQQLQKRLQKLQQDNKQNYYTTPASPSIALGSHANGNGTNGNGFGASTGNSMGNGMATSTGNNMGNGMVNSMSTSTGNNMGNGMVNGMSNGSLTGMNNSMSNGNLTGMNNSMSSGNLTGIRPVHINNSINSINGVASASATATNNPMGKRKYVGVGTPDEDAVEELLQLATKKPKADLPTIDEDIPQQSLPQRTLTSKEIDLYDRLLREKDERIRQLESDLEAQRQETIWLRKMLLEDMACVRSMLHKRAN